MTIPKSVVVEILTYHLWVVEMRVIISMDVHGSGKPRILLAIVTEAIPDTLQLMIWWLLGTNRYIKKYVHGKESTWVLGNNTSSMTWS